MLISHQLQFEAKSWQNTEINCTAERRLQEDYEDHVDLTKNLNFMV